MTKKPDTLGKDAWMNEIPGAVPRQRKKVKKKKLFTLKEKNIQSIVQDYLHVKGIRFIRIPDSVYRATSRGSSSFRGEVSAYLKGIPDVIILDKSKDGYNRCLLLELKREDGKLTQGQKTWHKGLNVAVTYSLDEALAVIDSFIETGEL